MSEKKKVISKWMSQYEVEFEESEKVVVEEKSEFSRLLDENSPKVFKEGKIYTGRVIKISHEFVTVDIGYKQEGVVSTSDFRNFDGSLSVEEGSEIDVFLVSFYYKGELLLSRKRVMEINSKKKMKDSYENGTPVEGTVLYKVKGGLIVDVEGAKAFLPGSHVELYPTKFLDGYVGKRYDFKIIKYGGENGNIVVSRKALIQSSRDSVKEKTLSAIKEGMIVKGVVRMLADYGAFVDIGGVDGLLHVSDMAWERISHPSEVVAVDQEIEVEILKFDPIKERVSLGLSAAKVDPWGSVTDEYSVGTDVEGEVTSVTDYGIFISLKKGIEGLVHVSEMSWFGHVKAQEKFAKGDLVKAKVIAIDLEKRRVSLGLKQLEDNPWDELEKKYPRGSVVMGKIRSIVDFGAFLDIGEEVDGLIHESDLSWSSSQNSKTKSSFVEGQEIKATILNVDKEAKRISLGLKQLEEDPWSNMESRYSTGTVVSARIVKLATFGAFAEIEEGIEGLIHISELSEDRVENVRNVVKEDDVVKVMVISIDRDVRRVGLSLKEAEKVSFMAEDINATRDDSVGESLFVKQLKGLNAKK